MDALSIATYAGLHTMNIDLLDGFEVEYAIAGPDAWMVSLHNCSYRKVQPMTPTRTSQIMSDMRSDNAAAIATFTESIDDRVEATGKRMRRNGVIQTGGPRYGLNYGSMRSDATTTANIILKGCDDVIGFSNNVRREFSLPRRALSMASSKGRVTPDMLESLMAFFGNPSSMASHLLASFLPERPSYPALVTYLDSLGIEASTADIKALKLFGGNRAGAVKGGRPRKVTTIVDGGLIESGIGHLKCYYSDALADGPIPGGNDTMHGAGHDQGTGWSEAWANRKPLTPAQTGRRDAALHMSSHGYRTDAEGAVIERW